MVEPIGSNVNEVLFKINLLKWLLGSHSFLKGSSYVTYFALIFTGLGMKVISMTSKAAGMQELSAIQ